MDRVKPGDCISVEDPRNIVYESPEQGPDTTYMKKEHTITMTFPTPVKSIQWSVSGFFVETERMTYKIIDVDYPPFKRTMGVEDIRSGY